MNGFFCDYAVVESSKAAGSSINDSLHAMKNTIIPVLLFSFTGMGCSRSESDRQAELEIERLNLLKADRAFAQTSKAQGAPEAFRFYLTKDALQLPNGGGPIRGRDSIIKGMRTTTGYTLEWEPLEAAVSSSKDFGYTWGYYTHRSGMAGSQVVSKGKYLNVWRKAADGSWKVLIDMGNTGVPHE